MTKLHILGWLCTSVCACATARPSANDRLEVGIAFTPRIDTSRIASFQGASQADQLTAVGPCAIAHITTGQPAAAGAFVTAGWVYDGQQCTALSETRACQATQCWPWTTEGACTLAVQRCEADAKSRR